MTTPRLLLTASIATLLGCASHPPAPALPAPAPAPAAETAPAPPPVAPAFRLGDAIRPVSYQISLTVDPARPDFSGVARIEVELSRPTAHIWMHGVGLTIGQAFLERDGARQPIAPLPVDTGDFLGFDLGGVQPAGRLWLEIGYTATIADNAMMGLFRRKIGDDWYLYSQFEATSARQAFPCFDEPRFKVPWQITVSAPRGDRVLSNNPAAETRDETDGTRTVTFAPTRPLSSYLVAIAVGPFELVDAGTAGRGHTPVRIAVPRGRSADAAHAAATATALLPRFEEYFDRAYPYPKLDLVSVPNFFGAMENPGLITCADSMLLADQSPPPVSFQMQHATIVGHELAHMWFGDLVTLAWWDDIWLNESFATWVAARVVDRWQPDWHLELAAIQARDQTMYEDSRASARRIHQPVDSTRHLTSLFDAIAYYKGGSVLWMFENWVGPEKFRDAVRGYLAAHLDGNATTADFLAALAGVATPEVVPAFESFLDQPGLPEISLELQCPADAPPAVALSQQRYLPPGSRADPTLTWKLPVCVTYDRGEEAPGKRCTLLVEKSASLSLDDATGCPDWVMGNAGGVGYYRTVYPEPMLSKLLTAGRRQLAPVERMVTIDDLRAMVSADRLGAGEALALVPRMLADRETHVLASTAALVASIDANLVPAKLRDNFIRFVGRKFGARARKLGWIAKPGEAPATRTLRQQIVPLVATSGEHATLIRQAGRLADRWLNGDRQLDPDMVGPVLRTAARYGDVALRRRMFAALSGANQADRAALLSALASFRDPTAVTENMTAFLAGDFDMRESGGLINQALADPTSRQLVYDFVKQHFEEIEAKLPVFARAYLVVAASGFCDLAHRDDASAFFTPRVADLPGGPEMLAQTLEQIELCAAARTAQEPSLTRFLKRY